MVVVVLEFSAGYLSLPDKGLTSLPPSPLLYTDRENVLHNCHCCFGFSMAQELTLPGPAQLHTSFLPSQLPLPQCGKSGILKEGESTPSSTAWLFFNSALLTNTAFPNYNSTRKLYSFIKKKKKKEKKPTQIQASQKFSPYKNKHIHKQSQSNQAGVLCPRKTFMQLEAMCQQNRIGFRFRNPRPSLESVCTSCVATLGYGFLDCTEYFGSRGYRVDEGIWMDVGAL